jgi:hypothetical protein
VLYYDSDAERQFAQERIAELAQEARRMPSKAEEREPSRMRNAMARLIQRARQMRDSRAPARA